MGEATRILYVCENCYDGCSEICGHSDRKEIYVTLDGRWLCDGCLSATEWQASLRSELTHPPEYKPTETRHD